MNYKSVLICIASLLIPAIVYGAQQQALLNFQDIETVHLYVKPSALAKADSAFSTHYFKKIEEGKAVRQRGMPGNFRRQPIFEYVRGYAKVNNGPKIKVRWRYRGLMGEHWRDPFPHKSLRIRFSDKPEHYSVKTLLLNQYSTDLLMSDALGHEFFHAYGLITPRIKLVRFFVNDQYAGFKMLVENVDDYFLKNHGLPLGNVYREELAANIGAQINSGISYYNYWWKKKTLTKQKNWDDWIHFNHVYTLGRSEVADQLLDIDYYIKFLSMGVWVNIAHLGDHNVFKYHNLKNQKWYPIPWDLGASATGSVDNDILFIAPNKAYASVLLNPVYYHKRNLQAWDLIHNDDFFDNIKPIIRGVYERYSEELNLCSQDKNCSLYLAGVSAEDIDKRKNNLNEAILKKKELIKNVFTQFPKIETHLNENTLEIKGTSATEFVIRKNGWEIKDYSNLTVLEEDESKAIFLINFFNENMLISENMTLLKPKPFKIMLFNNHRKRSLPQIKSFFATEYQPLENGLSKFDKGDDMPTMIEIANNSPKMKLSYKAIVRKNLLMLKKMPFLPQIKSVFAAQQPLEGGLNLIGQEDGVISNNKFVGTSSKKQPATKGFFKKRLSILSDNPLTRFYNKLKSRYVFENLNNRKYVKIYIERIILMLDKFKKREILPDGEIIRWSGTKLLHKDTIVPHESTLILEPGTVLKIARGASLFIKGSFKSLGTQQSKVTITSTKQAPQESDAWGSVCFVQSLSNDSTMIHTIVEHGSEDRYRNVYCRGALSVYNVPFTLSHSEFRFNHADDAANFLYSKAQIADSIFHNNSADALDLDFSSVDVQRVLFLENKNDGVDCGTALANISSSVFKSQGDKAVSIGEESDVRIDQNLFIDNAMAIAIKDGSSAEIISNYFLDNEYAINSYIKKKKFSPPVFRAKNNYSFGNQELTHIDAGTNLDQAQDSFIPLKYAGEIKGYINDTFLKEYILRDQE